MRHWAAALSVVLCGCSTVGLPTDTSSDVRSQKSPVDMATSSPAAVAGHIRGQVYRYMGGTRTPIGAGAKVWGYVFLPDKSGHTLFGVPTDETGHYDFANAPDGFVVLYAQVADTLQPCMHSVTVAGAGASEDIEVVAIADLTAGVQPHDIFGSTLSGTSTVNGVGTAGMNIELEYFPDLVSAWTYAGPGGAYLICGLTNTSFGGYASYLTTIVQEFVVPISGATTKNVGN